MYTKMTETEINKRLSGFTHQCPNLDCASYCYLKLQHLLTFNGH